VKVTFLNAAVPLAKTYEEIAPGTYREESYPHVTNVTSLEYKIDNLDDFHSYLVVAADEGMCLLKGNLDRPLVNESRAGHTTSSALTEWVCLDVDYAVNDLSPAEWLDNLHPAFRGVNFIFQPSASQGITVTNGWRGHFFLLLDKPETPAALKAFLMHLNLTHEELSRHLELSASGGALRYPLDVTTCQNDKLLFIAPPVTKNFERAEGIEQFTLRIRAKSHVTLNLKNISVEKNNQAQQSVIANLRKQKGLDKKNFKQERYRGCNVLTNPDSVIVSGKKEARGFVYLNLNGGDSWAYYFPVDNPEILFNFKGEPCMYMQDVDKDIYDEYRQLTASNESPVPFGFLWPPADIYFRGFADAQTCEVINIYATSSRQKLKDFFTNCNIALPRKWTPEEWDLRFDPTINGVVDFYNKTVNTYRKTTYLAEAQKRDTATLPPTIDRVLNSVCVTEEMKQHFLNWLAVIFQTRQKTYTGWIFQGTQGTGKGVLYQYILSPLIGHDYCHEMTMDRLDDDFNQYLERNLLLFIDEAKITDSKNGDRLLNRIKNLVTEDQLHIRAMRRNAISCANFTNIILASNHDEIILLEASDRRFNVAPRQERPIRLEAKDILAITTELAEFSDYLMSYEISVERAHSILLNDARAALIELSKTTVDQFFHAINKGDLSYFTQFLSSTLMATSEGLRYHDYAVVVKRWLSEANSEANVARDDLRTVYQYLQSSSISATKFSRMAGKYGLVFQPVRVNGELTRGLLQHTWCLDEQEVEQWQEVATDKVVSIRQ
jgi:hypothetical protein